MLDDLLLYLLRDWDGVLILLLDVLEDLLFLYILLRVLDHLLHLLQPLDQNPQYFRALALEAESIELLLGEQGNIVLKLLPYEVLHLAIAFLVPHKDLDHLLHEVRVLLFHLRDQLVKEKLDLFNVVDLLPLLGCEPYFRILDDVIAGVLRVVDSFDQVLELDALEILLVSWNLRL